ncbi:MAG: VCBS repeat-containing protein [Verrucomicrobiota bacterium]
MSQSINLNSVSHECSELASLLGVLIFFSILCAPALHATEITFANPVAYAVGKRPTSVLARDVNCDGMIDLITLNTVFDTISILTNAGNGTFVLAVAPFIDGGIKQIVPADLDGNGSVDFVCTSYFDTGDISLMTNDGAGGFVLAQKLHLPYPPDETHSADMNGDGFTDLIRIGPVTVSVYTNNQKGDISFVAPYVSGEFALQMPTAIMAADINGDRKMDLVLANDFHNTLTALTNGGYGGLGLASSNLVGASPYKCTMADVNNDRADASKSGRRAGGGGRRDPNWH